MLVVLLDMLIMLQFLNVLTMVLSLQQTPAMLAGLLEQLVIFLNVLTMVLSMHKAQ